MLNMVAALFVRKVNHYAALGCDCYDATRDALTWPGGVPGIPFSEQPTATTVERMGRPEPERTPEAFATWQVDLAKACA